MTEHTLRLGNIISKGVKAAALFFTLVLVLSFAPKAFAADVPEVDETATTIYANGFAILVIENDGIIWDVNRNGAYDSPDIQLATKNQMPSYIIYGGGKSENVTDATITVVSGQVAYIYAGGANDNRVGTAIITLPAGSAITVNRANCTGSILFSGDSASVLGSATVPSGYVLDITNGVTLDIPAGASLVNNGTMNNYGNMTVSGTLNNKGTLNNDGGSNSAKITVAANGELINTGTYTNAASSTLEIEKDGTVYNNGGGAIVNMIGSTTNNAGSVVINSNASYQNSGELTNTGTFTNKGLFDNHNIIDTTTGSLVNNGTLNNHSGGTVSGYVSGTGTIGGDNAVGVTLLITSFTFPTQNVPTPIYGATLVMMGSVSGTTNFSSAITGTWSAAREDGTIVVLGTTAAGDAGTKYNYMLTFDAPGWSSWSNNQPRYVFSSDLNTEECSVENDGKKLVCKYTVTTQPKSINGMVSDIASSVEYTGSPHVPSITLVDNGITLAVNRDYTITYENNINAGVATITIIGTGNYTGTVYKTFTITPAVIKAEAFIHPKEYDGTTTAYGIITMSGSFIPTQNDYGYTASFEYPPNAGTAKPVNVTIWLTGETSNYTFEGGSRIVSIRTTADIYPATLTDPLPVEGTLTVYNEVAHTYKYNLDELLPTFRDGRTFGAYSYVITRVATSVLSDEVTQSEDGKTITVPVDYLDSVIEGDAGYIEIRIVSENYNDLTTKVNIVTKNREIPEGTPTVSETITFGDPLSSIAPPSGSMRVGMKLVEGEFTWDRPDDVPPTVGIYSADWTFTPVAIQYAPVSSSIDVTVVPKPIESIMIAVSDDQFVYNGLEQYPSSIVVTHGENTLVEGKDYEVEYANNINAGVATVIIKGLGNYTASATADYNIAKAPLSVSGAKIMDKVYDGTRTATVYDVTFDGLVNGEMLEQNLDYTALAEFPYAAVGVYTDIQARVLLRATDKANNYCFANEEDNLYMVTDEVTISKAPIAPIEGLLQVTNRYSTTYYYNLNQLLPGLLVGQEFGDVTYEVVDYEEDFKIFKESPAVSKEASNIMEATTVLIEDDEEYYGAALIYVKITSKNFDFTDNAIIIVDVIDRRSPIGDPTVDRELIYGEALSALTISGDMYVDSELVPGTFRWLDPTYEPDAGTYPAAWEFTPDSQKYAPTQGIITVIINPKEIELDITLSSYEYVYDRTEHCPTVIVKNKDWVVPEENYDVYYDDNIYVGTAEAIVVLKGNYTGGAIKEFAIVPQLLVVDEVVVTDKVYDGNTEANVESISLSGFVAGETLVFGKDYNVTAKFMDADVGEDKLVSVSVILENTEMAKNYTIPRESANTTASITKANPMRADVGAITVANKYQHTYIYDLTEFLPALVQGLSMGTIDYSIEKIVDDTSLFYTDPYLKRNALMIPVSYYDSDSENHDVATIKVLIRGTNYEDIETTIYVSTTNRGVLQGQAFTNGRLTYGEKLEVLPLDGYMSVTTSRKQNLVPGYFNWKDGEVMPSAGTYYAPWEFTPIEIEDYASVRGIVNVGVDKATPTGTPTYNTFEESGHIIKEAELSGEFTNINNDKKVDGTLAWMVYGGITTGNVLSDATKVEQGVEYWWMFIPKDKTNYETRTGKAVLWEEEPEPTPTPTASPTASPSSSVSPTIKPSSSSTTSPTTSPSTTPKASTSPGVPSLADVINDITSLPNPTWEKDIYSGGLSQPDDMKYTTYMDEMRGIIKKILKIVDDYRKLSSSDKASVTDVMIAKVEDVYAMAYTIVEPERTNVLNMKTGIMLRTDRMTPYPSLTVRKLTADEEDYKEGLSLLGTDKFLIAYDVSLTQNGKTVQPAGDTEISFIVPLASNSGVMTLHKPDGQTVWEKHSELADSSGRYKITVKSLSPFAIGLTGTTTSGDGSSSSSSNTPPKTGDNNTFAGYVMLLCATMYGIGYTIVRRKKTKS